MSINRWNMRAVISTVDIEKSPSGMYVKYEDYAEELATLKAQRDELLAAAKSVVFYGPTIDNNIIALRAAIANAEAKP